MPIRFLLVALLSTALGCHSASLTTNHATVASEGSPAPQIASDRISPAQTTVVWVSIDGFRHDYLQRFHPPTLSRLAAEGAFTTQEIPVFPSLTFPNHISQITGVGVDRHGIPLNNFFDEADGKTYSFPDQSQLLRAEPIWTTATREHVRTACVDWPMSHNQVGPNRAAYFDAAFDSRESDLHRLDRIIALLNRDENQKDPYRLILGYMSHVDSVGHRVGPDSPQIGDAVLEADKGIDHFVSAVVKWFNATHDAEQELVLIFSTDHGMAEVKTQVSLERLIGAELSHGTQIVTSGPAATIHVPTTQPDRADKIVHQLSTYPYLTAWKSADVPAAAHFSDPTRIGQVVVMLKPGYSFAGHRLATTSPAIPSAAGMHGYDPAATPDMQGAAVVWRLRHLIGGVNLGPLVNTQWEPTVCKLLGIQPAPNADPRAVTIP